MKVNLKEEKPLLRDGTREADRLLEEHKGAEAEAKKLKAAMDSSVWNNTFIDREPLGGMAGVFS